VHEHGDFLAGLNAQAEQIVRELARCLLQPGEGQGSVALRGNKINCLGTLASLKIDVFSDGSQHSHHSLSSVETIGNRRHAAALPRAS